MKILLITVAAFFFLDAALNRIKNKKKDIILGKMELSDGWARPGSEGQNSAAYLRIANGTASSDTLLAIQSDAAAKAELHESYQDENNISGMRPIGPQIIAPATDLQLSPGGTHIMLINLQQDLAVGDTLAVSLEFARVGIKNLQVPVKIQE